MFGAPICPGFPQVPTPISPAGSVLPAAFAVDQIGNAVLTIVNGNALSTAFALPGDSFVFNFEAGLIATMSVNGPIQVRSSTLAASDFAAAVNAAAGKLVITYNGAAKPFNPYD